MRLSLRLPHSLSGGHQAGPHKIQGIGANFIPEILNREIYDKSLRLRTKKHSKRLAAVAKEEGILVGISSGAAIFAALKWRKSSAKASA